MSCGKKNNFFETQKLKGGGALPKICSTPLRWLWKVVVYGVQPDFSGGVRCTDYFAPPGIYYEHGSKRDQLSTTHAQREELNMYHEKNNVAPSAGDYQNTIDWEKEYGNYLSKTPQDQLLLIQAQYEESKKTQHAFEAKQAEVCYVIFFFNDDDLCLDP